MVAASGLMPVDRFSPTYREARRRFLDACRNRAARIRTYPNPHRGPDGGELGTDVAWLGPDDAERVLVVVSATHGVEGFCGSAAQLDLCLGLESAPLCAGTALCLVHAINPYGFAWLRRVTEEGVDLNRNFIDFTQPLPENPGYDALADALVPPALDGPLFAAAEERIAAFRQRVGEKAFQAARKNGQYRHPTGMFFGGRQPTWARCTLERIIADFRLAQRAAVAILDYHSGLGPYGYGEAIAKNPPGSAGIERARRWFGHSLAEPALGTSSTDLVSGASSDCWLRALADRAVFVAIEFGTFSPESGRRTLRADHWLHAHGTVDWADAVTRRIKDDLRYHYDPTEDDWREAVLFRSRQIQRQALNGLAEAGIERPRSER